jgi:hypothetical protein
MMVAKGLERKTDEELQAMYADKSKKQEEEKEAKRKKMQEQRKEIKERQKRERESNTKLPNFVFECVSICFLLYH